MTMRSDGKHLLPTIAGFFGLFAGVFVISTNLGSISDALGFGLFVCSIFLWMESIGLRIRDDILDDLHSGETEDLLKVPEKK